MPRTSQIYQERVSWPKAMIITSVVALMIIWTVIAWYTAGDLTVMPVSTELVIFAFMAMFGGIGLWGALAKFRYGTRKWVQPDAVLEFANPQLTTVKVHHYNIQPKKIENQVNPNERAQLAEAVRVTPGTNLFGNDVAIQIAARGGIDYLFYHTPERDAGDQGFVEIRGENKLIHFESCVIMPYIMEERDHSEVDPEIISRIEKKWGAAWRRNVSPIETGSELHPGMKYWLRNNPDAQGEVLQSIGYPRLASRFADQFTALMRARSFADVAGIRAPREEIGALRAHLDALLAGKGRPLDVTALREVVGFCETLAPRFPADGTPPRPLELGADVQKILRGQVELWLKAQAPLQIAMGIGHDGKEYWRSEAYGLRSQLTEAEYRLKLKGIQVTEGERERTDTVVRRRAAGGRRPGGEPVFDLVDAKPEEPSR